MKEINKSLNATRQEYGQSCLVDEHCDKDPFDQFGIWLTEALAKDPFCANAMSLSTISESGMPDSRIVLLRNVSYGGFTFYTNYRSNKGRQLEHNSRACLLFFWKELERQVKVQGDIRFLPQGESDDYFKSRPSESKIGAWASQQSQVVNDRATLDRLFEEARNRFANGDVPRPPHWGGYVLLPVSFEFWQGRVGRLHDRIRYTKQQNDWLIERLMP